ncbi:hypothetical protein MARCHEWKA_03380 [Brevundimonas phage vB_BpoS-Marchewka]|uniref:Uncharacterized protein n=1 Tax=Brevundimonas phage vB_BpoS-Marchewka TaxID=2948604 RepID=A0A9E7ST93_9CAUD|nr:hypothetical protein MARCHEWKA_03380 [Brevundimonas phage vB_BpoS-Marchewka]UTC29296.1 hypothetical protein BAMBUS_02140 [Brevundimonas phage vB_BpoS-Bambus]
MGLFRHNPPRSVIYDPERKVFFVRRAARRPTPDNPYEYYDRFDGRWEPAKAQVMDAFRSEKHARLYAGLEPQRADRGENDQVCA